MFFLSWLSFWHLLEWKKNYIKSKNSSLMPEGRSKWEVKKMALDKDAVSFPSWICPFVAAIVSRFQGGSAVHMLLSLCSRYALHCHCGWNQDSDQADDTLTWSRVPGQHRGHERLWGERARLGDIHHRWVLAFSIIAGGSAARKCFYLQILVGSGLDSP